MADFRYDPISDEKGVRAFERVNEDLLDAVELLQAVLDEAWSLPKWLRREIEDFIRRFPRHQEPRPG